MWYYLDSLYLYLVQQYTYWRNYLLQVVDKNFYFYYVVGNFDCEELALKVLLHVKSETCSHQGKRYRHFQRLPPYESYYNVMTILNYNLYLVVWNYCYYLELYCFHWPFFVFEAIWNLTSSLKFVSGHGFVAFEMDSWQLMMIWLKT